MKKSENNDFVSGPPVGAFNSTLSWPDNQVRRGQVQRNIETPPASANVVRGDPISCEGRVVILVALVEERRYIPLYFRRERYV